MLKISRLDGRTVTYTAETVFEVQTRNPRTKRWTPRYTVTGNLCEAVMYYNGINIGKGFAKRLKSKTLKPQVLAKAES